MNPAAMSFDQSASGRRWKSSLLSLYQEPVLLLSSVLCPCAAYRNASAAFEKEPADCCESVCGGVCFCCGFDLRSRFREKYNLRGNEGQDFCIHCWCNCCGLAQIRREAGLWNVDRERPKAMRVTEPGPSKSAGTQDEISVAGEIPLIERPKQTEEEIVADVRNPTPFSNSQQHITLSHTFCLTLPSCLAPESRWAEHASHISYTPTHG